MIEALEDRSTSAFETRRRREKQADATVDLPFGVHTEIECPACGEAFLIGIFGSPRDEPSFGRCSTWDCDALLKFVADGTGPTAGAAEEAAETQADLSAFVGGEA